MHRSVEVGAAGNNESVDDERKSALGSWSVEVGVTVAWLAKWNPLKLPVAPAKTVNQVLCCI